MSFICHPTQLEPTDLPRASASFNTRMARDAHHWPRADGHLKRCGKKLILKLRTTFPLREFACDASFGFGSCCWSSLTFGARQLKDRSPPFLGSPAALAPVACNPAAVAQARA